MGICSSSRGCCTSKGALAEKLIAEKHLGRKRRYISFATRLDEEWYNTDKNGDGTLSFKEIQAMLHRLNARIPSKVLKKKFKQYDVDGSKDLNLEEFKKLFEDVTSLPNLEKIFTQAAGGGKMMVAEELLRFLKSSAGGDTDLSLLECAKLITRHEGGSQEDIDDLVRSYKNDPECLDEAPTLTAQGFARLLTNVNDNSVINPKTTVVHQDMTRPLSHYFISSSHNTYLNGNQFNSESTADSITNALKSGVRVIEIDAWNGSDGRPIVTHGHTMCTNMTFADAIQAVHDSAFEVSDYPVIVTIENHCNVEQQKTQASIMNSILGDSLYHWKGVRDGNGHISFGVGPEEFTSPEALKRKIVIRDKPRKKKNPNLSDAKRATTPTGDYRSDDSSDDEMAEESEFKVAPELLQLMYIKNIKLKQNQHGATRMYPPAPYASSSSLSETKLLSYGKPGAAARELCMYAQTNLVRVYPKGTRVESSNYDPMPAWSCGCQVVALNYQTKSLPVWLDQGMFLQNGGCGYVPKPEIMLSEENLSWSAQTSGLPAKKLKVTLISGHYLPKPLGEKETSEVIDPYVEVSMHGIGRVQRSKTSIVKNNGFNPVWNMSCIFDVHVEELSLLSFVVKDHDKGSADDFIGQNVIPISCIRTGLRVVPLKYASGVTQTHPYLFAQFLWDF